MLIPARNWKECKLMAFDFYGENCLFGKLFPGVCLQTYTIDPAHIFGKGAHVHMKWIPLNVVPLNRWAHSMIDQYKHPATGCKITKDERVKLWKDIVGKKIYRILENINKQYYLTHGVL
jgi:hypothetical protein